MEKSFVWNSFKRFLLAVALLAGCNSAGMPVGDEPDAQPSVNIANYQVIREWNKGLEVLVRRSGSSPVAREDLEEIQRDLTQRYPMKDRSVVIYRDQRGEIGRFLVEGDRWNFRGEQ